jgi:S1-C subfamily serine protease
MPGLRTGDVVVALGEHEIDAPDMLRFRVATMPLGSPAQLDYWRAGASRTATLTVIAPPEQPPRQTEQLTGIQPFAGATVGNLNPAFDDELGLEPTQRGVVVSAVADGSPAGRLGLAAGDILASLNRRSIDTVSQLDQLLASESAPWTVTVKRRDRVLSVIVR